MNVPRISAFARLANGNVTPTRVITGQATLQARTTHDIGVDPIHDEIVVPNPFAQAILFFRGAAEGEEKPIRIIQGPKTMLGYTDVLDVDPVHGEIFVPQFRTDSILVFSREPGGDVAPIRIIKGPKTKLDRPGRASVDPINNLLAISTMKGVWIFDRTADGDTPPRYILAGPRSGVGGENEAHGKVLLYPQGKKIFYAGGAGHSKGGARGGFIGVWNYGDQGDVLPWAILRSNATTKLGAVGRMAIDPEHKELIASSSGAVQIFHLPQVF